MGVSGLPSTSSLLQAQGSADAVALFCCCRTQGGNELPPSHGSSPAPWMPLRGHGAGEGAPGKRGGLAVCTNKDPIPMLWGGYAVGWARYGVGTLWGRHAVGHLPAPGPRAYSPACLLLLLPGLG